MRVSSCVFDFRSFVVDVSLLGLSIFENYTVLGTRVYTNHTSAGRRKRRTSTLFHYVQYGMNIINNLLSTTLLYSAPTQAKYLRIFTGITSRLVGCRGSSSLYSSSARARY